MNTENYVRMMERWSQIAKDCTQVAVAALVLPVVFIRTVVGIEEGKPIIDALNGWFYASWTLLVSAIAMGFLYQISSARLIQAALLGTPAMPLYPEWQFRIMCACIIFGIILFVVGVLHPAAA
ncbi:hypothetical protein FHS96_003186 [Sphingomonas zeicaulis]|uniref:hypothetical protein n=1 Tax=Sphingomonas zeicaulis TaxID=1632740 RepID=UPI003D24956B